ncbi:hypothetical protein PS870_06553 [Pseudomonas fluorescens]|uniref:Uncharacterized protein n=1 Tax=Pseudomonas fluorescens TaxID=294 RepID=A0A5E7QLU3_PSEFL|nr:hypothetical protein PS870_06553 [Pseudomonas fluorescens]
MAKGAHLTRQLCGVGVLARVDDEHNAELPSPIRAQRLNA